MTARRAKPRDVDHVRVKYRVQVKCDGIGNVDCVWQPFSPADNRDARRQAREHAVEFPGHEVVATVADVTRYYLPNRVLARLNPPTDGDDQPSTEAELKED